MEDGGKREIVYLSLHCHHQNDSCIKMGSDESHFNAYQRNDLLLGQTGSGGDPVLCTGR